MLASSAGNICCCQNAIAFTKNNSQAVHWGYTCYNALLEPRCEYNPVRDPLQELTGERNVEKFLFTEQLCERPQTTTSRVCIALHWADTAGLACFGCRPL